MKTKGEEGKYEIDREKMVEEEISEEMYREEEDDKRLNQWRKT